MQVDRCPVHHIGLPDSGGWAASRTQVMEHMMGSILGPTKARFTRSALVSCQEPQRLRKSCSELKDSTRLSLPVRPVLCSKVSAVWR